MRLRQASRSCGQWVLCVCSSELDMKSSYVGWVRPSRNPTRSRQLRSLLGYDAARLTQPTQLGVLCDSRCDCKRGGLPGQSAAECAGDGRGDHAGSGCCAFCTSEHDMRLIHVGWVRRSRNPTRSRQLRSLLGYDAARLTQPTQPSPNSVFLGLR